MSFPTPFLLTFLSSLPSHPALTKVRFLGTIESYNQSTSTLLLSHTYPRDAPTVLAQVDLSNVLRTPYSLSEQDSAHAPLPGLREDVHLDVGEWVNVVGYVHAGEKTVGAKGTRWAGREVRVVKVRAVEVWGTGTPFNLGKYEEMVRQVVAMREECGEDAGKVGKREKKDNKERENTNEEGRKGS